ncbi:hypothetical protein JCM8097_003929 [Rhodosporidiobolus ruineniae]
MQSVPNECKAYNFEQQGAELKLQTRQVPQLKDHEVLIKVHACAINSVDEIARYDLLDMKRFAITPGFNVAGQIVKLGKNVSSMSHKLKEGQHVVAFPMYGGLSEYCVADASHVCPTSNKLGMTESCLNAYNAGRVLTSLIRLEEQHNRMSKEEREACELACREMGFKGEGILAVFGDGGQARLACDTIKAIQQHQSHLSMARKLRLVLVTPNDRWSPNDYDMKKEDVLIWGQCNVREELKQRGGAWYTLCTEMPQNQSTARELMGGMRINSHLVLLNPGGEGAFQLPVGPVLAKSISVCGAPIPTYKHMQDALELSEKAKIRIDVDRVPFEDQNRVREAWREMERGERFEAPVVEIVRHQQ